MPTYAFTVVRQTRERGTASIDVPDGVDPFAHFDALRETGDDFIEWSECQIDDLSVDASSMEGNEHE